MLNLLRDNHDKSHFKLTKDFLRDLHWLVDFVDIFNGQSFFVNDTIDHEIHIDACLTGFGGIFKDQVYYFKVPDDFNTLNIVYLEMQNILIALKIWGHQWRSKIILIHCGNQAVVSILNTEELRMTY